MLGTQLVYPNEEVMFNIKDTVTVAQLFYKPDG